MFSLLTLQGVFSFGVVWMILLTFLLPVQLRNSKQSYLVLVALMWSFAAITAIDSIILEETSYNGYFPLNVGLIGAFLFVILGAITTSRLVVDKESINDTMPHVQVGPLAILGGGLFYGTFFLWGMSIIDTSAFAGVIAIGLSASCAIVGTWKVKQSLDQASGEMDSTSS